ncbi:MAG TPA: hypothetical protein VFB86_01770 [Bacteroidales bacterium]|nr:hypothetical protein [Bacteroidales bacterium]
MDLDEEREAMRINPPIFKMHPDEFAKLGLTAEQIKAILRLQLDLAEKIARAHLEYCIGLKETSLWK